MSPLPLPVRVAAGLAVTAMDQARRLPTQLATLPVTVVSRALQAGMRVQQQVTELAMKGDEVFAHFRPVEENPPWAQFDEDFYRGDGAGDDGPLATVLSGPGSAGDESAGARGPGDTGAGEVDEADVARALSPGEDTETGAAVGSTASSSGPPPALPGYDEYSLAQLRGKLRSLSAEQLEALLAHERGHQDRAPFVTMLSNRITTVRSR